MRYPFESSQRRDSWLSHKNRGKELYEGQQYAEALREYQAALDPVLEAPRQEQQIILSNIVACRLKIGDSAELAVQEAKQCVALNPAWAKGHVRLASALVALGGHSNDACNALQTALRLDPGNAMARLMLLRELRRDHRPDPPINPDYVPPPQSQQQSPQSTQPQNSERTVWEDPVDDSVSIQERLQFYVARLSLWYDQLSSESKQILKLGIGLLVLYIAFGGRFGWESHHRRHGNYERGNLYDQYRKNYHSPP
jgi:tetratricopeptide (TPR) repeat protein